MAEAKKVIPLPTSKCARIEFLDPVKRMIMLRTFVLKADYSEDEIKSRFRARFPGCLIRKVTISERWKGSNTTLEM